MKGIIAIMLAAFTTFSCASTNEDAKNAKRVSQERTSVQDFDAISIAGSPDVHYTQGKAFAVKVVAPEKIIDKVKTEVEGHCLNIYIEPHETMLISGGINVYSGGNDKVEVFVTSPDIVEVTLNGSGDFDSDKKIDTDRMAIRLQGSGDMSFSDIVCDDINAELVGSGDVEMGNVNAMTAEWTVVGSGDMEVKQRDVANTKITLTGSGDVNVKCGNCGAVTATLRGSGDISLSGKVGSLQRTVVGSGDIHTSGLTVATSI